MEPLPEEVNPAAIEDSKANNSSQEDVGNGLPVQATGETGNTGQEEEEPPTFDQDLVEAFLEMEHARELVQYFVEMDKARYREVGHVLFQAFKQRNAYLEVKELFKTDNENPLDFNEAVRITTDIVCVSSGFRKLSKYLRVQLLYGLNTVKEVDEENKLDDETIKYIEGKWRNLRHDCLKQFSEVTGFEITKEMATELVETYEKNKRYLEAIELIQDYELYEIDFDYELGIDFLLRNKDIDKVISVLKFKPEFRDSTIEKLTNNKDVKYAATIIEKLKLDIEDYPDVKERLQKKTIRYYLF